jgi:hypothetical protein
MDEVEQRFARFEADRGDCYPAGVDAWCRNW